MHRKLAAAAISVFLFAGCNEDGGPARTTTTVPPLGTAALSKSVIDGLPAGVVALLGTDPQGATSSGCIQLIHAGERRTTKCNVKFGEVTRTFIHRGDRWIEEK